MAKELKLEQRGCWRAETLVNMVGRRLKSCFGLLSSTLHRLPRRWKSFVRSSVTVTSTFQAFVW